MVEIVTLIRVNLGPLIFFSLGLHEVCFFNGFWPKNGTIPNPSNIQIRFVSGEEI
jgi:hypothetical protein